MAKTKYEKMIDFYVTIDTVPTLEEIKYSKKCGEYFQALLVLPYFLIGSGVWRDLEKYFFSFYAIFYWFVFASFICYIVGKIINKHMYIYYKEIFCKDKMLDNLKEYLIYYGIAVVAIWVVIGYDFIFLTYVLLVTIPIGAAIKIKEKMEIFEDSLQEEKMQEEKKQESKNVNEENDEKAKWGIEYCPKCDVEITEDQMYCTNCGEKING